MPELSIMSDYGFFKLCWTMLKIPTDYSKIMLEILSIYYTRKVIMPELSLKSDYARIMLDSSNYARYSIIYARITDFIARITDFIVIYLQTLS